MKKTRLYPKAGVAFIIALAFIMPGTALMKINDSNLLPAKFEFIPVNATGSHTIDGNSITLNLSGGAQDVTLEIYASGWAGYDPTNAVKGYSATVDSTGYDNGIGDPLVPIGEPDPDPVYWPLSGFEGAFINLSRPDHLFHDFFGDYYAFVSVATLDYSWLTAANDIKVDEGGLYYCGTLILNVSVGASGTYTIDFVDNDAYTSLMNAAGTPIEPLTLTPALITIEGNTPPFVPSDPDPADEETDVDVDADLSWTGGDPDLGDIVTYDVYFGDSSPPGYVGNVAVESYDPGTLDYSTTYYWKIIADDGEDTTDGPIWEFTTEDAPPTDPDLDCDGSLTWTEVNTGSTVTGDFTVSNIGDPESELDWEIQSYPDWGTWSFSPDDGTGLTPEDGPKTINVEVVAPDEQETTYTGEIIVVNSETSSDKCTIPVSLTTPRSRNTINSFLLDILERLIERFPILAQILGQLRLNN